MHRFENGHFWPELPESGVMHKYKNTINIPLNEVGYGDAEYAAFMHLLVLPLIFEWKPELILVSCGYDAGLGDPQGEMEVSPLSYGYMTGLLASLDIPLCLLLEGGYFIESVSQGALYTIEALLDKKVPNTNKKYLSRPPSTSFLCSLYPAILTKCVSSKLFKCFIGGINALRKRRNLTEIQVPIHEYQGNRKFQTPYQTRGLYPPRNSTIEASYFEKLHNILEENKLTPDPNENALNLSFDASSHVIKGNGFPELKISSKIILPLTTHHHLIVNDEAIHSGNLFTLVKEWTGSFGGGDENSADLFQCPRTEFIDSIESLVNNYDFLKPLFYF